FDRLQVLQVEAPLNEFLDIHVHRIKDDRLAERDGDQDDMRDSGALEDEQERERDGAIVDERQADREQKGDRSTMEAVASVVALNLPNGEAQEHGKQDEDRIVRPSED